MVMIMATLNVNKPAALSSILALNVVDSIEAAKAAYAKWNTRRATLNELSKLSDRELNDIGVSRSEIRYLALTQE